MAAADIDEYLAGLDEPHRSTLGVLRDAIRAIAPDAEECISYGVPGFRLDGSLIAGFAAATAHLSYLPHSGTVLASLADELGDYDVSKGAVRFAVDRPLAGELVRKLIEARLAEL